MEFRNLGKSGLKVSLAGLGCNNFGMRIDLDAARVVVHKALDLGITLFDTADIYGKRGGSESMLGQILGGRRKEIVLATKFGGPMNDAGTLQGASRRYILSEVEASLTRLKTEWIDLYQIHWPAEDINELLEGWSTMADLQHEGKARWIGVSNFDAAQMELAQSIAPIT